MNPELQCIRIAESLGWTDIRRPSDDSYHFLATDILGWLMGRVAGIRPGAHDHEPLPDYLNSRDATAKALAGLTALEHPCFIDNLIVAILGDKAQSDGGYTETWLILTSTPAQLAEAYLRTKGLWEDVE
jgi:hypothetical protein